MADFNPWDPLSFGMDEVHHSRPRHINCRCSVGSPPETEREIAGWKELGIDWEEPVVEPPKGILHIDGKQMPGEVTISDLHFEHPTIGGASSFGFIPLTDDMLRESIQGFVDYIKREKEDDDE